MRPPQTSYLPASLERGPTIREVTIADLLDEAVARRPDEEAIVFAAHDDLGIRERWTYRELQRRVDEVAAGLIRDGIEHGDRVLVWSTNLPQYPLLQFALASIGAVLVPINPLYRSAELEHVLRRVQPRAVFLVPEDRGTALWDVYDEARQRVPGTDFRVALGAAPDARGTSWTSWIDGVARHVPEVLRRREAVRPTDLAQIQFTSGTTGMPKGVRLDHQTLVNQGLQIAHALGLRGDDRFVNPMPLFHCGGCVVVTMSVLAAGATQLPILKFEPDRVVRAIEQERATVVAGVPTMMIAVDEEVARNGRDISSIRLWVGGGALVPPEVAAHWREHHGVALSVTYGQTEFGPVATMSTPQDTPEHQVTTVGRPLPPVELEVVTPGTTDRVPLGAIGELRFRGFAMEGYHEDPEATAAALDDGWLRSGDLGRITEDGFVQITGRAKEMIIRGGENIAPASVENALLTLDEVVDASVVGVPDERYGEAVCAFVRLADGASLSLEQVRERLAGTVARFKLPSHLRVVDAFPLTPSGKVQKFRLLEQFEQEAQHPHIAMPPSTGKTTPVM